MGDCGVLWGRVKGMWICHRKPRRHHGTGATGVVYLGSCGFESVGVEGGEGLGAGSLVLEGVQKVDDLGVVGSFLSARGVGGRPFLQAAGAPEGVEPQAPEAVT